MSDSTIRKPADRKRACADRVALKMARSALLRQHKESGSHRLLLEIQAIDVAIEEISNEISGYDKSADFLNEGSPTASAIVAFLGALAPTFRQLRQRKRWSLAELSKRTGISKSLLSKYDTDDFQHTTLARLLLIAEAFAED